MKKALMVLTLGVLTGANCLAASACLLVSGTSTVGSVTCDGKPVSTAVGADLTSTLAKLLAQQYKVVGQSHSQSCNQYGCNDITLIYTLAK